jgi:glycosyltransferase involved in cell wall biosynthesis
MAAFTMPSSLPKLTIDIGPLFEDQWTGIPVFTRRLVQALLRHGGLDIDFAFRMTRIPRESVLTAIRAGSGTLLRSEFERNAGKSYPLIDSNAHLLFPSVKECFDSAHREASTVHDVSTLVMAENHVPENVDHHMKGLARQLSTNDVVFCVSEASRAALSLAYPSTAHKARLLMQYVDWPEEFATLERNLSPPVFGRYAAVIGTIEPRKNLGLLIRALAMPEIRESDLRFVVIGKTGWKVEQFMAGLTAEEREHLVFSGFVTEFMKYRLLRHAEFLVYPSIYEGFGIPALEAMSLGKPVLCAMTSSLPEVVGDAGVYFDPLSSSEFAAAFAEISDAGKLAELSSKARVGAAAFGWQRMAQPVVDWVTGIA